MVEWCSSVKKPGQSGTFLPKKVTYPYGHTPQVYRATRASYTRGVRRRLTIVDLFRGVLVGGGPFSPLAPVLGPEQRKGAKSPSSTVHGVQYDTKHATFDYIASPFCEIN